MDFVSDRKFHFAGCTLDLGRISLTRAGEELPLRPKSFDVLRYLVENPGRLVGKEELFEKVWAGVAVTDDSLVQCIKDIRDALGDDDHSIVKTLPRRGYMFAAEVTDGALATAPADLWPDQASIAAPATTRGPRPRWARNALAVCAALLLFGGGAWWLRDRAAAPPTDSAPAPASADAASSVEVHSKPAIAVLPFVSLSESSKDDYFADGLTEDIISALGRFAELSVRSRGAVFAFKGKSPQPNEIGRTLDVRYVVEGSVRRGPEQVRIAVRLTDAARGTVLWSQQYDATPKDIFGIGDDIVRRIAGTLAVRLTGLELTRIAAKPPASLEAYDLVLRGREALWRMTRVSNFQARSMFEDALALDANYVPAMIGLGMVESAAIAQGWTADPGAALQRAERLAERVLGIDETYPGGHHLLGRVHMWRDDLERAIDAIRRAIALNPSDPDSHLTLGVPLLWQGDLDGAIAAFETVTRFEPDTTNYIAIHLGMAYVLAGRSGDAIRLIERALARDRTNVFTNIVLAAALAEAGRAEEAARQAATVRKLAPFLRIEQVGSKFRPPELRQKLATALQKAGL